MMKRTNWKTKVKADVEKRLHERKGSDGWLKQAVSFHRKGGRTWKVRSSHQEQIVWKLFDRLPLSNRCETRYAFFQLVACLLKNKWKAVRISRDQNHWKKTRYNKIGPVIIKIMDTLHEQEYIGMKLGYDFENDSAQTRIWATEKLLEVCPVIPSNIIEEPTELVLLKGPKQSKNGKRSLIDYKDTRFTRKVRKKLKLINEVNTSARIKYFYHRIYPYLRSQFIEKWSWDGRLYTSGYRHVQGMSEEDRAELTINADPVIEADYSALHPRLLYAWEGIQYDYEIDPYTVVNDDDDIRAFLKIILLCMINENDWNGAQTAANDWLFKFERKDKRTGKKYKPYISLEHQGLINRLEEKGITKAGPLMEEFMYHHEPISKYLCTDRPTGFKLRNADSQIALLVLYHFAKKGIPILCVHDSFIVQHQWFKELLKVMEEQFEKQTRGFACPVEVKSLPNKTLAFKHMG